MKIMKRYSTLVELMILVPLFTFSIYVAIYFGEVTLTKINGVVSTRYIADTTEAVDNQAIKDLFRIERNKAADLTGHFWMGNDTIQITQQDKNQGQWPVSESGKAGNVIHEYLIEYGFDVNVTYELVGNSLERKVSFSHPDGGLDLMRYFLYSEADDVIQKLLQERITYSNSQLSYDYANDTLIPSNFNEVKNGNAQKAKNISFNSDSRSMILLNNTLSRNFYKDFTSVNRITSIDYDSTDGNGQRLTDGRMSGNSAITNDTGGTQLNGAGSTELYWTADSQYETVRSVYPIPDLNKIKGSKGDFSKINVDSEQEIDMEEMENSYLSLSNSWETINLDKTYYSKLGF